MFLRIFQKLVMPILWLPMSFLAGYELTGRQAAGVGGVLAYSLLFSFTQTMRLNEREDYWASKLAMLKAETKAVKGALAEAVGQRAAGALPPENQVLIDAYRTRLALLEVSRSAIHAGYLSWEKAGSLGHWSETKGGLLPDAA